MCGCIRYQTDVASLRRSERYATKDEIWFYSSLNLSSLFPSRNLRRFMIIMKRSNISQGIFQL